MPSSVFYYKIIYLILLQIPNEIHNFQTEMTQNKLFGKIQSYLYLLSAFFHKKQFFSIIFVLYFGCFYKKTSYRRTDSHGYEV